MTDQEIFNELSFYTLSKGDAEFMHQHAVDAFAAQHAGPGTKPISLVFGLVGLQLALERGWTGRQVQLFHMKMARHKRPWPEIVIPATRGSMTVKDVMMEAPGPERDERILEWCRSVWMAYADGQDLIRILVIEIEPLP